MKHLTLRLEHTKDVIWGRVKYKDNLIVDSGKTQKEVSQKMKKRIEEFHSVKQTDIIFDIRIDS